MNTLNSRRLGTSLKAGVAALPLLIAGVASPAFAQSADDTAAESTPADQSEIVVTGTLIRGVAPVGSPVITVTPQDIKETGGRTINDVLSTVPQFSNLFNQTVTGAVGQGRQVVQPRIHGLDTLILLDGRRMASAGAGASGAANSIDPSIIPTGVLGGIEVVPDGGSALYGSDAVGGVVNMRTLKRFNGFSFDGTVTLGRDYSAFTANGVAGKDWGTGSIFVAYAYNKTNKIFGKDRPFLARNPLNNQCSPGTIFARNASGSTLVNTYSFTGVTAQGKPTAYTLGPASCNRYDWETVVPDEQMHSVFAGLTQDLNSSISVDLRAFWSQRKSTAYSAVAVYGDEAVRGVVVGKNNPYYTPTPDELLDPTRTQGVNVSLARAVGNSLPQNSKLENWGVSGEFKANLFGDFQARLLGNYNEARLDTFNYFQQDAGLFAAALQRTDATALNPYDPAFSAGSILVAQQIVNHPQIQFGLSRQAQARLVMDGSLFELPGGAVKIAVGGELIRENFKAGQETRKFDGTLDGVPQSLVGARTVKSVFGEVNIPVISPESGGPIHAFNLSAAARYDHYSDFGGTFNPRFAATIEPVEWLTFRGSYGHSFLAPSLPQLFSPQVVNRSTTTVIMPPGSTSLVFLQGGNPKLQPQKATTWSLGLDIKAPFAEGLRASLTYYNVNYRDKLGQAGAGPIQLGGGDFYTDKYAAFWVKDPTLAQAIAFINSPFSPIPIANGSGALTTIESLYGPNGERTANSPSYIGSGRFGNLQRQIEKGLDFSVSYKQPMSFGSLDFQVAGNLVLDRKISQDGVTFVDGLETDVGFRGSVMVGADVGNFRMSATLMHTSGHGLSPVGNLTGQSYVKPYNTVRTFVSYTFKEDGILADTALSLQINNLFDVLPPRNLRASSGYDNGDLLGRTFQLGLKKKF